MRTINVLSVDFDYIMAPCIALYNDFHSLKNYGKDFDPKLYWEEVNKKYLIDNFLSYDEDKLLRVENLVLSKSKGISSDNIHFAKEHDSILTYLCQDKRYIDSKFNIYNVDHHHDIFYTEEQDVESSRFYFASCADWVNYLFSNDKLNTYYWFKNVNSDISIMNKYSDLFEIEEFKYINMYEDDLIRLNNIPFDIIFICLSETYFPYKYQNLFYSLKEKVEQSKSCYFNIDNIHYCPNGKSRLPLS